MLLYFSVFLHHFPGIGLFRYITFRAVCAILTSALVVFSSGSFFIRLLQKWQRKGQPIRVDGPQTHLKKAGTPTMGGLLVLGATLFSSFLWGNLSNIYVWTLLFVMCCYGAIGFWDDYLKVTQQNERGFSGKGRLILEALVACLAVLVIMHTCGSGLGLPFVKNYAIDLGVFFVPFGIFVIVGAGNAVNFTDGLDGLAIGPVMITGASFAVIAYLSGNHIFADYLQIAFTPGTGELVVLMASMVGAGLGFLWFNAPPAAIFMGDTGSLALGGILGTMAVATKHEIVLAIIGGLFVIEALSVILQVASFKLRGKRIFLMAPIHHHFEKKGWSESQVVMRFWILSIVFALIGLSTLKLR